MLKRQTDTNYLFNSTPVIFVSLSKERRSAGSHIVVDGENDKYN
jgi:hypothetical protein